MDTQCCCGRETEVGQYFCPHCLQFNLDNAATMAAIDEREARAAVAAALAAQSLPNVAAETETKPPEEEDAATKIPEPETRRRRIR